MKFGGFQKTSLIDFPGRISSILFTLGCNLRCPFCHNWRLIAEPPDSFLSDGDAIRLLESRRRYVQAVVITGGEPTMQKDLPVFVKKIKEKGFTVKLDTNGFYPQRLERCLPYLDYVAMDVKTSCEKYKLLGPGDIGGFLQSIEMLKEEGVDYEFRNTVVPGFVTEDDIANMGEMVRGGKRFVFQQFVPDDTMDKSLRDAKPYSPEVIARFAETMRKYVGEVALRM